MIKYIEIQIHDRTYLLDSDIIHITSSSSAPPSGLADFLSGSLSSDTRESSVAGGGLKLLLERLRYSSDRGT